MIWLYLFYIIFIRHVLNIHDESFKLYSSMRRWKYQVITYSPHYVYIVHRTCSKICVQAINIFTGILLIVSLNKEEEVNAKKTFDFTYNTKNWPDWWASGHRRSRCGIQRSSRGRSSWSTGKRRTEEMNGFFRIWRTWAHVSASRVCLSYKI